VTTLEYLNTCSRDQFIALVGPVFEGPPWIAAAAVDHRPFPSRDDLYTSLCDAVRTAGDDEQLALIKAHPDLVGRAVLTAESSREQSAAGLDDLTPADVAAFDRYNSAYTARFGFPFIICARKHRKEAILRAFPERLSHGRGEELETALDQIFQIALLRLSDLLP
jgi:2-oxo-4-hydroxy-4-carboxy-5-ureidoimidazoline decarboxylase